jgi:hypothetical protein
MSLRPSCNNYSKGLWTMATAQNRVYNTIEKQKLYYQFLYILYNQSLASISWLKVRTANQYYSQRSLLLLSLIFRSKKPTTIAQQKTKETIVKNNHETIEYNDDCNYKFISHDRKGLITFKILNKTFCVKQAANQIVNNKKIFAGFSIKDQTLIKCIAIAEKTL